MSSWPPRARMLVPMMHLQTMLRFMDTDLPPELPHHYPDPRGGSVPLLVVPMFTMLRELRWGVPLDPFHVPTSLGMFTKPLAACRDLRWMESAYNAEPGQFLYALRWWALWELYVSPEWLERTAADPALGERRVSAALELECAVRVIRRMPQTSTARREGPERLIRSAASCFLKHALAAKELVPGRG